MGTFLTRLDTRAAKVAPILRGGPILWKVRGDHKRNLSFCFCILTVAHFGHFHFRCWW